MAAKDTAIPGKSENIKVVIRARPLLPREQDEQTVLTLAEKSVSVAGSGDGHGTHAKHSFNYDQVFDSTDPRVPNFASQEDVYAAIGAPILQNSMNGYNGCLFAYGQTGSGKSFSIMGYGQDPGVIPRLTEELFAEKAKIERSGSALRIWVSYLELYREHIRDLLLASEGDHPEELKVVEHPKLGVYVPHLTESPAEQLSDVQRLMDYGTKRRVTASTNMNATSSRSHAVFVLKLQKLADGGKSGVSSRMNIVDLAGSERSEKTGAEAGGKRFSEGCSINFALTALGQVIRELTEKKNSKFASYRTSKLTFMLKDSIGGNAKTTMLAAISPAASSGSETVSTLNFAASVKKVVLKPSVNLHTSNDEVVKHLKDEIAKLKKAIEEGGGSEELTDELKERHRLVGHYSKDHEEHLAEADALMQEREEILRHSGLSTVDIEDMFGVEHDVPYLLNVSDDPLLTGSLLYFLKPGVATTVGSSPDCTITLKGLGIPEALCTLTNRNNTNVTLERHGAETRLICNGTLVTDARQLKHNDWIMLGRTSALRIGIPRSAEAAQEIHGDAAFHEMPEMLKSLVPEESDAYAELRYYVEEMVNKMDQGRVHGFFETLREACPLVDEANEITRTMIAHQNLKFEVEFVWDIYNCVPEEIILIRVLKFEDAQTSKVLYYWSFPQFKARLERMRDSHHLWMSSDKTTWPGDTDALEDPWQEVNIVQIKQRLAQIQHKERSAANQALDHLTDAKDAEKGDGSGAAALHALGGNLVAAASLRKLKKAAPGRASMRVAAAVGRLSVMARAPAFGRAPREQPPENRTYGSPRTYAAGSEQQEIAELTQDVAAVQDQAQRLRDQVAALKKELAAKIRVEDTLLAEMHAGSEKKESPAMTASRPRTIVQQPGVQVRKSAAPGRAGSVKQLDSSQTPRMPAPLPGTPVIAPMGPPPLIAPGSFVAPGSVPVMPVADFGAALRAGTPPPLRVTPAAAVRAMSPAANLRYASPPPQERFPVRGPSPGPPVVRGFSAAGYGPNDRLVAVTSDGWLDATGKVHAFANQAERGDAAVRQRSEPARARGQ